MPTSMRCVVLESFGDPATTLTLGERAVPEPGPGQARVRMRMSPIHNHDLAIVRGVYGYQPTLPAVPGTEATGVIDALGDGASERRIGQRVMIGGTASTWAEYFLAPAAGLIPVPDAVPDEVACQLIAMPISAMALLEDLKIPPGEWMIQNTANGAVGKTVAMLAKARGVHVVNLVRRDQGVSELAAVGVWNAVSTERQDWRDRVQDLTGGAPIVRGVDSIGGTAADDLLDTMAPNGLFMSFGAMSGKPLQIGVANLLFKQTTIKGYWSAKRMENTGRKDTARMIGELIDLSLSGDLRLPIAAKYDLSEAGAAVVASAASGRGGKVVLTS